MFAAATSTMNGREDASHRLWRHRAVHLLCQKIGLVELLSQKVKVLKRQFALFTRAITF